MLCLFRKGCDTRHRSALMNCSVVYLTMEFRLLQSLALLRLTPFEMLPANSTSHGLLLQQNLDPIYKFCDGFEEFFYDLTIKLK
jgi:hypothetical protein